MGGAAIQGVPVIPLDPGVAPVLVLGGGKTERLEPREGRPAQLRQPRRSGELGGLRHESLLDGRGFHQRAAAAVAVEGAGGSFSSHA